MFSTDNWEGLTNNILILTCSNNLTGWIWTNFFFYQKYVLTQISQICITNKYQAIITLTLHFNKIPGQHIWPVVTLYTHSTSSQISCRWVLGTLATLLILNSLSLNAMLTSIITLLLIINIQDSYCSVSLVYPSAERTVSKFAIRDNVQFNGNNTIKTVT